MKSPAFQFYAKDWLSSAKITVMTLAQEGAYIRLLAHCWDDEDCSLPDDDEVLSKLSRAGEEWCKGGYNLVKLCFQPHPDKNGYITNKRLLQERQKQKEWREKSKIGGKKSAAKRWGTKADEENKGGYNLVKECLQPFGNSAVCSLQSASNKQKKEITNVISKENRKTRLPDSFAVTEQHRTLATTNGWPSPDDELAAFRDYHLGHGKLMFDWDRTFYTWLRNAKTFQARNSQTNRANYAKQLTPFQQRRKDSIETTRANIARADALEREQSMRDVTPASTTPQITHELD